MHKNIVNVDGREYDLLFSGIVTGILLEEDGYYFIVNGIKFKVGTIEYTISK